MTGRPATTDQNGQVTDGAWALPEQSATAPDDVLVSEPAPTVTDAARARAVPHLTVFERPLTIADTLDGAFTIIKERPRTVVLLALLFVVPIQLLVVLLTPGDFGAGTAAAVLADPEAAFDPETGTEGPGFGPFVWISLLQSLSLPLIAAPLSRLVEGWYLGIDRSVSACLRGIPPKVWLALPVAWAVSHVVIVPALFLVFVPGLALMALWMLTAPAIAVEGLGPIEGLRRSWLLVRRRFWPVLWIGVLSAVVAGVLGAVLPLLPVGIAVYVGLGADQYVAGAGTIATSLLIVPFSAGAAVLAYFDLRVRTEGLDLQLAMAEHFPVDAA